MPTSSITWIDLASAQSKRSLDVEQNLALHGDNLPLLHALTSTHAGRFQSVYLDPPYNTGTAFEHYVDDLSHAQWLDMMDARLRAIQPLLAPNGFIGVQIDDRELAYLQVLMDGIFGRTRRVSTIVVKMSELSGVKMTHVHSRLPKLKEYILLYANGDDARLIPQRVSKQGAQLEQYLKYYTKVITNLEAPVEAWRIEPIRDHLQKQGQPFDRESIRAFQLREAHRVVYRTNNAVLSKLSFATETAQVVTSTGTEYIWWQGKQMLFLKDYTEEWVGDLWTDISTINLNKEGGQAFRYSKKPEALLERFFALTSQAGDWTLDAFGGSGTSAAVAHKMGRRFVVMEQGEHFQTHILPRLNTLGAPYQALRLG